MERIVPPWFFFLMRQTRELRRDETGTLGGRDLLRHPVPLAYQGLAPAKQDAALGLWRRRMCLCHQGVHLDFTRAVDDANLELNTLV
jgi:hypothetical protein